MHVYDSKGQRVNGNASIVISSTVYEVVLHAVLDASANRDNDRSAFKIL